MLGFGIWEFFRDPVAIKEVNGSTRRWQTFAGRCLYAVLIGLVVSHFWTNGPRLAWNAGVSEFADLGRRLFKGFLFLQMVIVSLGAAASAADLVTKEVRAGTLGLLASSPLTPWRIALGKWKAAMAQTSTLLLCGAPVLAVCVFLGGATAAELAASLAVSVSAAALSAALALYLSSQFRTGVVALLVTLAVLGALAFLPSLGIDPPSFDFSLSTFLTCMLHPAYAAIVSTEPNYQRGSYAPLEFGWVTSTGATALLVATLLRLTAFRIGSLTVRAPAPPILDRTFEAMDRFYEDLGPERFRRIRFFEGGEVWESTAILWKELRTRASGRLRNSVRIAVGLLLLIVNAFWLPPEYLRVVAWILSAIVLLMGLASGASLFVKEKEERKWDILLATPLTSPEIVWAKLVAGVVPLIPIIGILALFWGAIGWLHRLALDEQTMMMAVALLPSLLGYAISAVCSLHARTLRGAFMTAFGFMAAILVAIPFLVELGRYPRELIPILSPVPHLERVHDLLRWGSYYRTGMMRDEFGLFVATYSVATSLLLAFVFLRFDRVAGRS